MKTAKLVEPASARALTWHLVLSVAGFINPSLCSWPRRAHACSLMRSRSSGIDAGEIEEVDEVEELTEFEVFWTGDVEGEDVEDMVS